MAESEIEARCRPLILVLCSATVAPGSRLVTRTDSAALDASGYWKAFSVTDRAHPTRVTRIPHVLCIYYHSRVVSVNVDAPAIRLIVSRPCSQIARSGFCGPGPEEKENTHLLDFRVLKRCSRCPFCSIKCKAQRTKQPLLRALQSSFLASPAASGNSERGHGDRASVSCFSSSWNGDHC